MQEFNFKALEKIEKKLDITRQNAIRYKNMAYKYREKVKNKDGSYRYKLNTKFNNKYEALNECLNLWFWDKYEKNKVLDLQTVNRCKDRFCPNCRSVSISQALVNFSPKFKHMLDEGYYPYMITLTVPNVTGEDLEGTINKMNKAFQKFNRWFYKDTDRAGGYKDRFFKIGGMVKALEVTVQKTNWNKYHPHFHCIAFLDTNNMNLFNKYLPGPYSNKNKSYIKYSDSDIHIQKLWKFAYDDIRITKYNDYPDIFEYDEFKEEYVYYQCDIRPLDMPGGIYEVFKYTFKDSDIHTQDNFETLYNALYRKRLRQGHGELYNLELDCEGEIDKEKESLEEYLLIDKKETPEQIITREIQNLKTDYHEYKKISRFKGADHALEID